LHHELSHSSTLALLNSLTFNFQLLALQPLLLSSPYPRLKNPRYNSRVPYPKIFRVLFVCIGNACRSPMAESIALREASDIIDPSSAGLFPLGYIPPSTQQTLQNNGYSPEGLSSKPILRDAWDNADLIINLSGRRRDPFFDHSDKVEDWDVADPFGGEPEIYQQVLEEIA